jgi:hypothetical protein
VISGIVVNESRLSGMLKSKVDMGGGLTMLELRVTEIEVMSGIVVNREGVQPCLG